MTFRPPSAALCSFPARLAALVGYPLRAEHPELLGPLVPHSANPTQTCGTHVAWIPAVYVSPCRIRPQSEASRRSQQSPTYKKTMRHNSGSVPQMSYHQSRNEWVEQKSELPCALG